MTNITDAPNAFFDGIIGGLQRFAGVVEYVVRAGDQEHSYKDRDCKIINSARKAYAAVFPDAPMPLAIRYKHESQTLTDKVEITAAVPNTGIYSPPRLLPIGYSLTEADLGINDSQMECRTGILTIQDYLNKLNESVPGNLNLIVRIAFNYGHKSDALRYIFSLMINAFFELSALNLTDHTSLRIANQYISFLDKLLYAQEFREACDEYDVCDNKKPLVVLNDALTILLNIKKKIDYCLYTCGISEQIVSLYKKIGNLVQNSFNFSVYIISAHELAQLDTCIPTSSKMKIEAKTPALMIFRQKLAASLIQPDQNHAMPSRLLDQGPLKIQSTADNDLSGTPFLSTDQEINDWVKLLLNDGKKNGVYVPFKTEILIRQYVNCCSNLVLLAQLKHGLGNLSTNLKQCGDIIAVMKLKVAIEVHLELVENKFNQLVVSRGTLLEVAEQHLRNLPNLKPKPAGADNWQTNYLSLVKLVPSLRNHDADSATVIGVVANIKSQLKSWTENPDKKIREFLQHNYDYYLELHQIARRSAKGNPSIAARLPALEREMEEMRNIYLITMRSGNKPAVLEELEDNTLRANQLNQQPKQLLPVNETTKTSSAAVNPVKHPKNPTEPPAYDSYPDDISRGDNLKNIYKTLIAYALEYTYLSKKRLMVIPQNNEDDTKTSEQIVELLNHLTWEEQDDQQVINKLFVSCRLMIGDFGHPDDIPKLSEKKQKLRALIDKTISILGPITSKEPISQEYSINVEPAEAVLVPNTTVVITAPPKAVVVTLPTPPLTSEQTTMASSPDKQACSSKSPGKPPVTVDVEMQEVKQTAKASQDQINLEIQIRQWVDVYSNKPVGDPMREIFEAFWNSLTYLKTSGVMFGMFPWLFCNFFPYSWFERESILKYHLLFGRDFHNRSIEQRFLGDIKEDLKSIKVGEPLTAIQDRAKKTTAELMSLATTKEKTQTEFIEKKVGLVKTHQEKSKRALDKFIQAFGLNLDESQEQAWCEKRYNYLIEQLVLLDIKRSDAKIFLASIGHQILNKDEVNAFDNYLSEVLNALHSDLDTPKGEFLSTIARGLISLNANPLVWVDKHCKDPLTAPQQTVIWKVFAPQMAFILPQLEYRSLHLGESVVFFKDELKSLIEATRTYGETFSKRPLKDASLVDSQVLINVLKYVRLILNESLLKVDKANVLVLNDAYNATHQALVIQIEANSKIKNGCHGKALLDKIVIVHQLIERFATLKQVSRSVENQALLEAKTKQLTESALVAEAMRKESEQKIAEERAERLAAEQKAAEERTERLAAEQKAKESERKAKESEQKIAEERAERLAAEQKAKESEQKAAEQAAQIAALMAALEKAQGQQPPSHYPNPLQAASTTSKERQASVQPPNRLS